LIVVDSEIDFFKIVRQTKKITIRKVEKALKSNMSHNSYIYEELCKYKKGKNYYGKKRRYYSDYS